MRDDNDKHLSANQAVVTNVRKLGTPFHGIEQGCVHKIMDAGLSDERGKASLGLSTLVFGAQGLCEHTIAIQSSSDKLPDRGSQQVQDVQENDYRQAEDLNMSGTNGVEMELKDGEIHQGSAESTESAESVDQNEQLENVRIVESDEEKNASEEELYESLARTCFGVQAGEAEITTEGLLDEGIRLHDLGVTGNKKAREKAQIVLQEVWQSTPENYLAQGYYGSSLSLILEESLEAKDFFQKMAVGLSHLDLAIRQDSTNIRLRLLRENSYQRFLDGIGLVIRSSITDVEYLIQSYEADRHVFEEEQYWSLLFSLGLNYFRLDKKERAIGIWTRLLDETNDLKYRTLVSLYLGI